MTNDLPPWLTKIRDKLFIKLGNGDDFDIGFNEAARLFLQREKKLVDALKLAADPLELNFVLVQTKAQEALEELESRGKES